jgi:hypothetical protein
VTAAAGVAGIRAVMPSHHHNTRHSVGAHITSTGAAADLATRAGWSAIRSRASTPGRQGPTRTGHGALGPRVANHASSGTASAGRASSAGRHMQRAAVVGRGGTSSPATGRRARGPRASVPAASDAAGVQVAPRSPASDRSPQVTRQRHELGFHQASGSWRTAPGAARARLTRDRPAPIAPRAPRAGAPRARA